MVSALSETGFLKDCSGIQRLYHCPYRQPFKKLRTVPDIINFYCKKPQLFYLYPHCCKSRCLTLLKLTVPLSGAKMILQRTIEEINYIFLQNFSLLYFTQICNRNDLRKATTEKFHQTCNIFVLCFGSLTKLF